MVVVFLSVVVFERGEWIQFFFMTGCQPERLKLNDFILTDKPQIRTKKDILKRMRMSLDLPVTRDA